MERRGFRTGEVDKSRKIKVKGIGERSSTGRRSILVAMLLRKGNAVRFTMQSDAMPDARISDQGEHILLVSLQAQRELGFVKDVRGVAAYLQDYK